MKRSRHVTLLLTSAVVFSACRPPVTPPQQGEKPPSTIPSAEASVDPSASPSPSASPAPVASSGGSGFLWGLLAGRMFSRGTDRVVTQNPGAPTEKKYSTTTRNGFGGYGSTSAGS